MTFIRRLRGAMLTGLALVTAISGCVETTPPATVISAPRFSEYPTPEIPASLTVDARTRTEHEDAWRRLQAGDLRRARQQLTAVLKRAPAFYPAETALGYVELASKRPKDAAGRFATAISRSDRYVPAWMGQADAALALDRDADAIAAMERVLVLDPRREAVRGRLELVRFRLVQSLIETGRQARAAGQVDQARQVLEQALARSPSSGLILHELVLVEHAASRPSLAEGYARRAVQTDPQDAEAHATLASLLAEQGSFADAADSYERAVALDARGDWRREAVELRAKAKTAALPPEFAAVTRSTSLTRAQVAAFVGIRLEGLINRAPVRVVDVATDVRRHWAAPWILPVTRAGVMSVFPNHTFQPGATVTRATLAAVVAELLRLATTGRPGELSKWQAARPRFPDVPATHVTYRAAALVVASGAMATNIRGEFEPTDPASGADLDLAVRRVESLTSR